MLLAGCTGFIAVETVAASPFELQWEGRRRKRGRRGAQGCAASSVQMGIWSSGYMHMYACERQIEEQEGERRENAIPDYMCLCCSVGGHVSEEARERSESGD